MFEGPHYAWDDLDRLIDYTQLYTCKREKVLRRFSQLPCPALEYMHTPLEDEILKLPGRPARYTTLFISTGQGRGVGDEEEGQASVIAVALDDPDGMCKGVGVRGSMPLEFSAFNRNHCRSILRHLASSISHALSIPGRKKGPNAQVGYRLFKARVSVSSESIPMEEFCRVENAAAARRAFTKEGIYWRTSRRILIVIRVMGIIFRARFPRF